MLTVSSLYARLLGTAFDSLPTLLKEIHDARPLKRYSGRCSVSSGEGWLVRTMAAVLGLPRSHPDCEITVVIERNESSETWFRSFHERQMRSVMTAHPPVLEERLGPLSLAFELAVDGERITWRLRGARLSVVPMPTWFFRTCEATESILNGRYCFDVRAAVIGIGLIVHYRGWLVEDAT